MIFGLSLPVVVNEQPLDGIEKRRRKRPESKYAKKKIIKKRRKGVNKQQKDYHCYNHSHGACNAC